MIEYITVSDLSKTYKDIANIYTGTFAGLIDGIKDQAKTDIYRLIRNAGFKVYDFLRKTTITLDEVFELNEQYCLLVEVAGTDTTLTIEYYFDDDTAPTHTTTHTITADTKTYLTLDAEKYCKISSTETVTLYKIDESIFQMFYCQILSIICESGALGVNEDLDIWAKRAHDLNKRVTELINSRVVYDSASAGAVDSDDLDNQVSTRNFRFSR